MRESFSQFRYSILSRAAAFLPELPLLLLHPVYHKAEKYDTIETCNSVKIFSNFYLPIELVKITNSEIVEKQITYGTEEAKQLSVQKACEKIEEKLQDNPEVLQKYVNTNVNNDYVEAEVTYEVLENIGTKEKIVF